MGRKKQILVVEDNEINREMLQVILSEHYSLLEAENGQEALDILKDNKEKIALILLDVIMPVMDGYTFLDIIKKDEELSLIPVIVMTQGDREEDEVNALSHGATDFIRKPYSPLVMKHRIASIINLRETAAMINQFQYDRLTGLYTKEFFYTKVRECLNENPDKNYTIVSINLVNFKLFNDIFGRRAGDRLLVEEARFFRSVVGENAICCRYTADRLIGFIESSREKNIRACYDDDEHSGRIEILQNMNIKVGVYEIIDKSILVEQMCDRALLVGDTIKDKYDQNIAIYDDTLRNKLLREQAISDCMETALNEEQFIVYLQPKYNVKDDSVVGAEALVRWIHPEWGFMSPGEFIPLFEKNGFIRMLDAFVWEKSCQKLREWMDKGYPVVPVSVNVSRADVYNNNLVDTMCSIVKKYDIPPQLLHLEITESAYTENPGQIISTVDELREKGFVIEMDDFGSGYSSLNMLGQMSIDILKLDMAFIRSELDKAADKSLLQDVINMAHHMKLCVVAEGVETLEQKERLQSMDCDYIQGYFYSKPLPVNEFEEMLKNIEKKEV